MKMQQLRPGILCGEVLYIYIYEFAQVVGYRVQVGKIVK